MKRIVVIGFGPAGLWSAISARMQDPSAEITVLTDEKYLTYSRCGLPYVIGGEIEAFEHLIVASPARLKGMRISVYTESRVVDVEKSSVVYECNGYTKRISFDSLIIATGAYPFIPKIPGKDLKNVFTLRTIDDAMKILHCCKTARKIAIIGAGAIGLELSEALRRRGLEVMVVEMMPKVLPAILDADMSSIISNTLVKSGVSLLLNSKVEEIMGKAEVEGVIVDGEEHSCDAVILATGVKPRVDLAEKIGVKLGKLGGIAVDDFMRTSVEGVYAAGDCVEARHLVTGKSFLPFLGTVAYRQGKIAGKNAAGGTAIFRGALGSTVLKIFDVIIGSTGLTVEKAREEGYKVISSKVKWVTRAEYFPGYRDVIVKLVFNEENGKIIGGQVIGGEEVAQRVNLISLAIQSSLTAEELASMDTCYSPPVSDTIDPISRAAEIALKKLRR